MELAERLLAVAPPGMARVLFQCSGSEANDAAIKLAWLTHAVEGRPERRKIIGRMCGYHGSTVATVSLSGQPHMYSGFGLPLPASCTPTTRTSTVSAATARRRRRSRDAWRTTSKR